MSVIKGYTIQDILAKGRMATIYLSQQDLLKRRVALKTLSPKIDEKIRDYFIQEGQVIARLKHPSIIPIFDVGRVGVHFYHAMEYLEGGNLEQLMARGLEVKTALEITLELADALHLAHSQGIIHADIKPSNVVFRANGCPVLTDFGFFRNVKSDDDPVDSETACGSSSYASPELIQGNTVDLRTDIYSLGILMYEMLTGAKPFASATGTVDMHAGFQQPAPQLPAILSGLQPLLEHMLAADIQKRLADASMITRYIRKYLRHNPEISGCTVDEKKTALVQNHVVIEYSPETRVKNINGQPALIFSFMILSTLLALGSWIYLT